MVIVAPPSSGFVPNVAVAEVEPIALIAGAGYAAGTVLKVVAVLPDDQELQPAEL